tara:strand:+ start:126 stop:1067 length:942 start_codon:yes stop_codon:yes gene_type:complete
MPQTRLSSAYKGFGKQKKTFASGINAIRQLEQEQQFKSKKRALKGQQTQDFFAHAGQAIGLAGTTASMYGEYQKGQEARESVGQAEYEEVLETRKSKQPPSLATESPFYSAGALGIEEWSDLSSEQKQEWMPQKDYGFDTSTRWGKWGKTFADISELTGDWDPDYKIGDKNIKMSHMKSLYDLSQIQDIAQEYGIKLEAFKNDPSTGDGSKSLKSRQRDYSKAADETIKPETNISDLSTDKYWKDISLKHEMKRWVTGLFENLKVDSQAEFGDYDEIETNAPISGNKIDTHSDIPFQEGSLESELQGQSGYFK